MSRADYNDGRDAVSGEIVTLVPANEAPPHFTDRDSDARILRDIECAYALEDRHERLRAAKISAAIGVLRAMIADAESGDGITASRVVQAASADLIIALLAEQLQQAKAFIPDGEPARLRIEAALNAAGF